MPNEQFFSYVMARTSYIQLNDDDVHFVLDQPNSFFMVLVHKNNNLWVDTSFYSDTLS